MEPLNIYGRGAAGFSQEEIFSLMVRISSIAPAARDFYLGLLRTAGGKSLITGKRAGEIFAGYDDIPDLAFGLPEETAPDSLKLVVSPLGCLSLAGSSEELGRIFGETARSMVSGGLFAFDLDNFRGFSKACEGATRVVGTARLSSGVEAVLSESRSLLPGGSKSYCRIGVEELDGAGKVRCKSYRTLTLLALPQKKIVELARGAGLSPEGVFGGFGMEPLETSSPVQLWLFRKGPGGKAG